MTKTYRVSFEDRGIRLFGILLFSILGTVFMDYGERSPALVAAEFITMLVGTALIWHLNRAIIFYYRCDCAHRMSLGRRLLYQVLLNLSISLLTTVLLAYPFNILVAQKEQTLIAFLYFFMNNFLTIIIFVLLINALYESLFLFQSWQESVLEVEKYKKASLEAEYQNLKGQLNPHFLFNSFNTLAQLVEESPQKAVAFIEGLSDVYRYVLNCRDKEWALLREELKFMEAYLLLLKGRYEAHLQVDFAPEVAQQAGQWYVPPLALQMLIENAIKHNEISSAHPLQIQIRIENESLVVQNNRQQRQVVPSSTKIGLQNIRERYRLMANKSVEVAEDEHSFAVSLPLIQLKMG